MADQYFHFTLGPVQSFVAQARRTRDFWAGSFLLSWLSGVAMVAVQEQSGKISFPVPDESFLDAIRGSKVAAAGAEPKQGSIPNRFMAEVNHEFDPDVVINAVYAAWEGLAELIWQQDLQGQLDDQQRAISRDIWQRQVQSCWEINWVLTENEAESQLLTRRKNWRSHLPPPEPGVKCMMMSGLQELSGTTHPHAPALATYWQALNSDKGLDLRPREYLSAIGFIKRRFVRHFEKLNLRYEGVHQGMSVCGWTLSPRVPSVNWVAASFWLAAVIRRSQQNQPLADALKTLAYASAELNGKPDGNTKTACIQAACQQAGFSEYHCPADGESLFEEALVSAIAAAERPAEKAAAQQTLDALNAVCKLSDLPRPEPYYAVLLMDGDSLGKQMSEVKRQGPISTALEAFISQVDQIVQQHSGFLVYAGGDDVMALMPVESAIPCATELRNHYRDCFRQQNIHSSLSGAIECAHIRQPLTDVLASSHQLLDEVAKDQTGRDALAIRVTKHSGPHLVWSQPWAVLLGETEQPMPEVQQLAQQFYSTVPGSIFSSSFLYRLIALGNALDWQQLDESGETLQAMIVAELARSGVATEGQTVERTALVSLAQQMSQLGVRYQRQVNKQGVATGFQKTAITDDDALKLLIFLARFCPFQPAAVADREVS
ncbi:MAG: type III-B CRISPR-associated protein Cas10/Cmr2 [Marinobacterium sp.]|nr:type III-B CRISPR-associated protein Cas10/Cmr2 [Marinobacterium sp.]